MIKWWIVKCDDNDSLFNEWINRGIISAGWNEVGNPKDYETKDKLLIRCDEIYSKETPIYRIQIESQLWKFSKEISEGDIILSYRKTYEQYYFAIVLKSHEYVPEISNDYPNVIKVRWLLENVPENLISTEIKNYYNSSANISQIIQYEDSLKQIFDGLQDDCNAEADNDKDIKLIKEIYSLNCRRIKNMENVQLTTVINELLNVLEYKIEKVVENEYLYCFNISFEDRLKLHKSTAVVGILKTKKVYQYKELERILNLDFKAEKLILVSLEGFAASSRENINEEKVKLIAADELVQLIFENYCAFSDKVKDILPLKNVYI